MLHALLCRLARKGKSARTFKKGDDTLVLGDYAVSIRLRYYIF